MQQDKFGLRRMITLAAFVAPLALTASAQSFATTITENPGSYARDTTFTGANGRTARYENNASWGNGSYADTRTVTGVNGKTATSITTASHAPGSTSRQTTVTGFNGQTSSYENNRVWSNGTYSDTRSYTGVNGGTRSDTVSRSGGVVTNTVTGRNGNTWAYSRPARLRR
jgi:hypothetical protein